MPRIDPPVEHRFPANRPYAPNKGKKGPQLTTLLRKLLNKEMSITDPEAQKVLGIKKGTKAKLKKIIMLRYILNAVQGENPAIEGIMDRIDGKLASNGKKDVNVSTIVYNISNSDKLFSRTEAEHLSHQRK